MRRMCDEFSDLTSLMYIKMYRHGDAYICHLALLRGPTVQYGEVNMVSCPSLS